MDPDVVAFAHVLTVIGSFVAFGAALFVGVRFALLRMGPRPPQTHAALSTIDDARFARLEQAVDAIAVEVERISEAQRFTTRLLSGRVSDADRGQANAVPAHRGATSR